MSRSPSRLAAAALAAALALTAQAQDESAAGADWGAAPRLPPPSSPVVASPDRVPLPDGLLTLELLGGAGGGGAAKGLRASFGLEAGAGWRFELGGGALFEGGHGAGPSGVPNGAYDLVRTFVELSVGRRFGRLEPWVAVGMSTFSVERPHSGGTDQCLVYGMVCLTGGGSADGGDGITAPALAAGVRVALSDALLAGVAVRKSVAPKGTLGDLDGLADVSAPWVGLSLAWRLGGGR